MPIELVPVEVISVMLQFLSLQEQFTVRCVHGRWNDALASLLEDTVSSRLTPFGLWDLNAVTQSSIRYITCLLHRMHPNVLQLITTVRICDWWRMPDRAVARIFSVLCSIPSCGLRHVWLSGCPCVGDATMGIISGLDLLESLSFYKCDLVTEAGVTELHRSKNLKSLTFLDQPAITNCAQSIGRLNQLRRLDLTGSQRLTNVDVRHLSTLGGLTGLNVTSCYRLTDSAAVEIAKLSKLEWLSVARCEMTAKAIAEFSKLTDLRSLNLSRCSRIDDAAIESLTNPLTALDVSGCQRLTAKSYDALSKMLSLQLLKLSHCSEVSDKSVALLAGLPDLVSLSLCGCDLVTAAGILQLLGTALEDLNVANCTQITKAAIQELEASGVEVDLTPCGDDDDEWM